MSFDVTNETASVSKSSLMACFPIISHDDKILGWKIHNLFSSWFKNIIIKKKCHQRSFLLQQMRANMATQSDIAQRMRDLATQPSTPFCLGVKEPSSRRGRKCSRDNEMEDKKKTKQGPLNQQDRWDCTRWGPRAMGVGTRPVPNPETVSS